MADPFRRLIQAFPEMQGECLADWTSENPQTRARIRESLKQRLSVKEDLSDLNQTPDLKDWSTSISHAKGLGGWVAVKRPARVGFDIEIAQRIKATTLERVCSPQEIAAAPDPRFLWCAKEALYKALESEQPVAVTQLTIGGWSQLGDVSEFQGLGVARNRGLVVLNEGFILAVCFVSDRE